ncbi:Small-conductance mechanosensitive channel [Aliiroseovarius sp. xm-m-354]|nr:Small-conductance mechanosensitive channel [Aliiroseovarius sp. xm-m-354]
MLFKNPVYVRTDQKHRRQTVICGVAYDVDVDEARTVMTKAVEGCKTVEQGERPIQVFAQEFADSSINFEITWWAGSTPVEQRRSRDEVVTAVKQALDQAGLEIPFPYRTLTFKEPLPLTRSRDGEEDTEA